MDRWPEIKAKFKEKKKKAKIIQKKLFLLVSFNTNLSREIKIKNVVKKL